MQPSRNRPAFLPPDAASWHEVPRGEVSLGPTALANSSPIDVPDDLDARVPVFVTRRKAEALPKLRPAAEANEFDWQAWHRGFRCGVLASVVGTCLGFIFLWGI